MQFTNLKKQAPLMDYIFIYNSTCFDHIVLIIRREKLYQYNLWQQ